jgi:hypothetical protein
MHAQGPYPGQATVTSKVRTWEAWRGRGRASNPNHTPQSRAAYCSLGQQPSASRGHGLIAAKPQGCYISTPRSLSHTHTHEQHQYETLAATKHHLERTYLHGSQGERGGCKGHCGGGATTPPRVQGGLVGRQGHLYNAHDLIRVKCMDKGPNHTSK